MCTVCTRILFRLMLYCGMCLISVSFIECHYESRRRATKISYFTPTPDYETLTDEYDKAHTPHVFEKNQDYRLHDSRIPTADDYEETEIVEDNPEHITLRSWNIRQNVGNVDVEDGRNIEDSRSDYVYREIENDREMPRPGMAARDYEDEESSPSHRSINIRQRSREPVVTVRPVYHADDISNHKSLSRLERLNQRLTRPQEDEFNTEQQRHQRQSLYKDTVTDDDLENPESVEYSEIPDNLEHSKKTKFSEKARENMSWRGIRKGRKTRRGHRKKIKNDSEENDFESGEAYPKEEISESGNEIIDVRTRGAIVGIAASEESEWNRLVRLSSSSALTAGECLNKLICTLLLVLVKFCNNV